MSIPTSAILEHLNLTSEAPTLDYLHKLLTAWSSRIPWESASRIARHLESGKPADFAWFAEDFFINAIQYGTGGTCFESNFASRSLLSELGFNCTLHFCDMEKEEPNPHCAVVTAINGKRYLADVGYPISSPLELRSDQPTAVTTPVYHFEAIPQSNNGWEIRRSAGDYEGQAFVLKGNPVDEDIFRERLLQDHQPTGLFLDEVILSRTTQDCMWRYSEGRDLVKRTITSEEFITFSPEQQADLPTTLSRLFNYDRDIIETALNRQVESP